MTKVWKKILISLSGAFAFLFAGFFFTACGVDYNKISLTANVSSVELEVGESADVVFTIENYEKGFSNRVQFNPRSDETEAVFDYSDVRYLSDNQIRVTIRALVGGHGQLSVKTFEGDKECVIDVNVTQYSTSMASRNEILYVSNDTNFVPAPNMFEFDNHTTHTELTHYYFDARSDFDQNSFTINEIDVENGVGVLRGSDSIGDVEADVVQFDTVRLEKLGEDGENHLVLYNNGQNVGEIGEAGDLSSSFKIISVYDDSVNNNIKYEHILFAFNDVYVMPSLDVQVTGGYLDENNNTVDFQPLTDDRIVIVPNNSSMRQFILKFEMIDAIVDSEIKFTKTISNNFVDVDFYDDYLEDEEDGKVVSYWKISQNSQTQNSTEVIFEVFYALAANIFDDSVNTTLNYNIDIEIAPTAITVNGSSEPDDFYLYNEYESDRFGWQEVLVDVVSGFNSSPSYEGIYFEFDPTHIEVKYGENDVVSSVATGEQNPYLYTNLSTPFYIRGKGDLNGGELQRYITIHLVSEVLPGNGELELMLNCIIQRGATAIQRAPGYSLTERARFLVDFDGGPIAFDRQLYADQSFQDVTYTCSSATNIVSFELDEENPYELVGDYYFLNLTITPIAVGDAIYTIYLDNGVYIQLNFSVIRTLKPETTEVYLLDSGNEAVTSYSYSREDGAEFDNILNIEILNASTKDLITYGSVAYIGVSANVSNTGGITYALSNPNDFSIALTNSNYRLTTLGNGNTVLTLMLKGSVVEDFAARDAELTIIVNASSYSLVSEFYLRNGSQYALDNTVYYGGNTSTDDKSVVLTAVANNPESSNFYRYAFAGESFVNIFDTYESLNEDDLPVDDEGRKYFTYTASSDDYYMELVQEQFSDRFVYFYALSSTGNVVSGGVSTFLTVTKSWIENGVTQEKTIRVQIFVPSGLMFFSEDFTYEDRVDGAVVATYFVDFNNEYDVGFYGTFNLENLTYVHEVGDSSFVLEANVSQRNLTRRYNARITPQEYVSIESISLASAMTELNMSSKLLTYSFGVYVYPTYATNKTLIAQFVPSNGYEYETHPLRLVDCTVSEGENGIYLVTVSCERFYNAYGDRIIEFTDDLSGTLYIYPQEWGNSYTMIGDKNAIVIDIQYSNGSENNPYVLETAQDVLDINSNEIMLRSHYKISTVIDMSSVKNATPIGILNTEDGEKVVGFSGSIVGTSSQAQITNIAAVYDSENGSGNNFATVIDGVLYAGLFAQIGAEDVEELEQSARIVNVSFTGRVDLSIEEAEGGEASATLPTSAYVSILSARNKATLENVGVTISSSNIVTDSQVAFGAVTAENYGYISQDFTRYDGSDESSQFNGLSSKNLAYYNDFLTIETNDKNVFAGGIAGISYGTIERKVSTNSEYKTYGYSAYSSFTKIKITGTANGTPTNGTRVFLGGAIGKVTNEQTSSKISKIYGGTAVIANRVENLLVGGEVSTMELSGNVQDAVGGILGYANTNNRSSVDILSNTSRCFLRGIYNVGGIAGFDTYSSGNGIYVNWGDSNKIEAVDDGRGAYDASLILKTSSDYYYDENQTNSNTIQVFYAIGNALNGTDGQVRDYEGIKFSAVSYVRRDLVDGPVTTNNASTTSYYGDYIILKDDGTCVPYEFENKDVTLGELEGDFKMTSSDSENDDIDIFMMFYFAVQGRLDGSLGNLAQDEIDRLNYFSPNSDFYPFKLESQDVSISSASSGIVVDLNGNMTVKGVGLSYITLNSILNVNVERRIYLYVVNYFNKDFSSSMFYTRPTSDGLNVIDDSVVNIYGNSNTTLYLVPSYELKAEYQTNPDGSQTAIGPVTADGDVFSVTSGGILTYKNVGYVLNTNSQLYIEAVANEENQYSSVQPNKQSVVFFKDIKDSSFNGDYTGDYYTLRPVLNISFSVDGKDYTYYYELSEGVDVGIEVRYRDSAQRISPRSTRVYIKTNEPYTDNIEVVSTNEDEVLFYEIFYVSEDGQELVQSRLPDTIGRYYIDSENGIDTWKPYINEITSDDLFDINFIKNGNVFNYSCRVNDTSERFLNRANENIYGEYRVYLYASELENGVSSMFRIFLSEAELNYIDVSNYSNMNDISVADEVVVPSQTGLLEISIDPIEATFNTLTISNSYKNFQTGATKASLMFVYELNTEEGVEFVQSPNSGVYDYENGVFTISYQEIINYYKLLNDNLNRENGITSETDEDYIEYVQYKGKVYISYYMPSLNVEDGVEVGFDVAVTYGEVSDTADEERQEYTIDLVTKLGSYARLTFDDKEERDGAYYVARGLSYGLTMEAYGFSSDQISVSVSDNSLISVVPNGNGRYTLNITSGNINYGSGNEPGKRVEITTYAEKIVDNVVIPYQDTLTLYIMEYVMDYAYVEGVNEDIVAGMEDGVINIAIGNPFDLEFSVWDMLEYDSTNSSITEQVNAFITQMTANIEWAVYYNGERTVLAEGRNIVEDYYRINSFTFTPLRIYNPETNIYHFSAGAYYTMKNGTYQYSAVQTGANRIYTEFVFDVHEQSTQDSPIPIETYEEFLSMQEGEWYILLDDIILPSIEYAEANGLEQYTPMALDVAGLDGNGKMIEMSGTYDFSDLTGFGVFSSVGADTILQNIDVCVTNRVATETILRTNQSSFNVGVLASSNEGVITNCEVTSLYGTHLSVVCSTQTSGASGAYIGGLVGINSGYITNSRSTTNIYANVNVGGFVGQNSGLIASSYFRNATLRNQTSKPTEYTAGFAVVNSGRIYTSYVSGDTSEIAEEEVYYQGTQNAIISSNNIAGFVYTNTGSVEDCYSNITLSQSGAYSAGFIFENGGTIEKSFSTSLLESYQTSNYGFIMRNVVDDTYGTVVDCYYLSDPTGEINVSIGNIVLDERIDLQTLDVAGFGNLNNFRDFAIEDGQNFNSVWFVARSSGDATIGDLIVDLNRPELVAPNIEATSVRELDRTEEVVDPETGMSSVRYIYTYVAGYPALGSQNNPILIYDAESMEDYITGENNDAGYNYSHYRLIRDIDYSEYEYNSGLYQTRFMGYLEGNFMEISGISLISSTSMNYAGLFAEVGRGDLLSANGTIMNFTVRPVSVSFGNTNVVGAVVGRLDSGVVLNVNVENQNQSTLVVSGNNIVGGVVGMAIGDYKIQNAYSQVSAKSRYLSVASENYFDENLINFDQCSMAGSVAGVLSGTGEVYDIANNDASVSVMASKAGLLFGLIDEYVTVGKVELTVVSDMVVNAHTYGGFIVGESKGQLSDVTVNGFNDFYTNFMKIPYISSAIGGVAGLVSGGEISDVTMSQSIQVSTESDQEGVQYLGGLAGLVTGVATISDVNINAGLVGFDGVGGVVGGMNGTVGQVNFEDISFTGDLTAQGHNLTSVGVGGLVGVIGENSTFMLTASSGEQKNKFDVTITSTIYTYGENLEVNIGAIVGSNENLATYIVEDTNSRLIANINAYEMSEILEQESSSMVVSEENVLTITGEDLSMTSSESQDCEYFCNVSFGSPKVEGISGVDLSHTLLVTNIGQANFALGTTL